jgi:hypothetical protein
MAINLTAAGTVVDVVAAELADNPATPVADTDTCLATAPRVRNVTTAAKLAICPVNALPRFQMSAFATSASNLDTSRRLAPTSIPLSLPPHTNRALTLFPHTLLSLRALTFLKSSDDSGWKIEFFTQQRKSDTL